MLRVVKKNATAGRHKPLVEVEEGADDCEEEVVDGEDSDLEMDLEMKVRMEMTMKSRMTLVLKNSEEREESNSEPSDLDNEVVFKFDKHGAVQSLLKDPPVEASKTVEVIQFCVSVIELHRVVYPGKSLSEFVISDVVPALEALETPAPPKGRLKGLVTKLLVLLGQKIKSLLAPMHYLTPQVCQHVDNLEAGSILPVLFSLALSEERYILV
ncbi:hypothetical protein R1sor_027046 [Riccia sorocarpa]|uniref:Uncharacterized protein n=1 Tax=Riccia sorocarpa TaxID=122646 RepID=A0ABD3GD35_9MARC